MSLYHVCDFWDGGSLLPLGDEEKFLERWPDSGDLGQYHAHLVHLYATLEQAVQHQRNFGGEVLVIDEAMIEWEMDTLEESLPHPVTRYVPAWAITRLPVQP